MFHQPPPVSLLPLLQLVFFQLRQRQITYSLRLFVRFIALNGSFVEAKKNKHTSQVIITAFRGQQEKY